VIAVIGKPGAWGMRGIFPVISLLTDIFPCYEFSKLGEWGGAESPEGPSLLAIAVIGKPGGSGKRDIFPVIFPDHGNLGQIIFPVNANLAKPGGWGAVHLTVPIS
jgi:hypothetical protein